MHFLHPVHLGSPPSLSTPGLWKGPVDQLCGLSQALTPSAALRCVMSTWDSLLGVLGARHRHAQADDYMPIMAWVIIQARPTRLVSQLHFIYNYALEQGGQYEMWMAHFTAACDMICRISPNVSAESCLATQLDRSVWVAPVSDPSAELYSSPSLVSARILSDATKITSLLDL